MKTCVIYASKTEATKKCAYKIQKALHCDIFDLDVEDINPENYDFIVIGSPIRMGMIHKNVKKWVHNNLSVLLRKKTALFVCCGFEENKVKYFQENFPKELVSAALTTETFGGEIDLKKQKGIEKMIVKKVLSTHPKEVKLNEENINLFLEKVQSEIL